MEKEMVIEQLQSICLHMINTVAPLKDEHFFRKESDEKWSVAEHLQHLSLCILPINNLLKRPAAMTERWGTSGRVSRTLDKLMDDYRMAVSPEPRKAIPAFVPKMEGMPEQYSAQHGTRNQEKVDDFYRLTGTHIASLPETLVIASDHRKENIFTPFKTQTDALLNNIQGCTEDELDSYQLPWPYLGLVTLGEICWLTWSHTGTHLATIQQICSRK